MSLSCISVNSTARLLLLNAHKHLVRKYKYIAYPFAMDGISWIPHFICNRHFRFCHLNLFLQIFSIFCRKMLLTRYVCTVFDFWVLNCTSFLDEILQLCSQQLHTQWASSKWYSIVMKKKCAQKVLFSFHFILFFFVTSSFSFDQPMYIFISLLFSRGISSFHAFVILLCFFFSHWIFSVSTRTACICFRWNCISSIFLFIKIYFRIVK